MTVKQWLSRGYDIDKEINALLLAQARVRASMMHVTPAYSGDVRVQTSVVRGDQTETAIDRLMELEKRINERIDALTAVKAEILGAIAKVGNATLRALLTERYVNFKAWEAIAAGMHYDTDHVRKYLHSLALSQVSKIIF